MTKLTQIIAGVAAIALLSTAAQAATVTVKASDLDLASPAGKQELDRRAEAAAKTLCKGVYEAQTNCVPGAKSKIIAKAAADGSATVDKSGRSMTFVATGPAATAVAAN